MSTENKSMTDLITQNNIDTDLLSEMVHDAASQLATQVNNNGLSHQTKFLSKQGFTAEDIYQRCKA